MLIKRGKNKRKKNRHRHTLLTVATFMYSYVIMTNSRECNPVSRVTKVTISWYVPSPFTLALWTSHTRTLNGSHITLSYPALPFTCAALLRLPPINQLTFYEEWIPRGLLHGDIKANMTSYLSVYLSIIKSKSPLTHLKEEH